LNFEVRVDYYSCYYSVFWLFGLTTLRRPTGIQI
jgi:hypothetical protein